MMVPPSQCLQFHLETIAIMFLWVVWDTTEWRTKNGCTIPLKWWWRCTILCGVRERCRGSATGHIQGVWGCWGLHSPGNRGQTAGESFSDIKLVRFQAFCLTTTWQQSNGTQTSETKDQHKIIRKTKEIVSYYHDRRPDKYHKDITGSRDHIRWSSGYPGMITWLVPHHSVASR